MFFTDRRRGWRLAAMAAVFLAPAWAAVPAGAAARTRVLNITYGGVNYYAPDSAVAPYWTWLEPARYDDPANPDSPKRRLDRDLAFMTTHNLGRFQRVWVCIDELMKWDKNTGYQGFEPQALANLDDAILQFAHYRVRADLVLLSYSEGSDSFHQFHPECLDGLHPQMRAGYLRALRDFTRHLASLPEARQVVPVMDLENEAYYQLEAYFQKPGRLGTHTDCRSGRGNTDTGRLDEKVITPWLRDMYRAARRGSRRFSYTVSDTGRLLNTDRAAQQRWIRRYPVDIYDIHLYDGDPAAKADRWRTGLLLPRPWFAGEVGCKTGDIGCTYDGVNAAPIDGYWLQNMRTDGCQAVLIENRETAWSLSPEPAGALTPTGQLIVRANEEHKTAGD